MIETKHYLIDYMPKNDNPEITRVQTLPYKVKMTNFKIPRAYDSSRMIGRLSTHEISYYKYSLWAVRPQIAVTDMIMLHVNQYRLFDKCQREFIDDQPNYEITGSIDVVEVLESIAFNAAHMKGTIEFIELKGGSKVLIVHHFDREIVIPDRDYTMFAKAVSDIVKEETELFLVKVVNVLVPIEAETPTPRIIYGEDDDSPREPILVR